MKARNRKTGEIVDIISYSEFKGRSNFDYVSYIDSKRAHIHDRGLNYYLDFELVAESKDDVWEQRRYEIAKAVVQGIWSNPSLDATFEQCTKWAIEQADNLINKLKENRHD